MMLPRVVLAMSLWWLTNTLASVMSKSVMESGEDGKVRDGSLALTSSFKDLRWVDLTALQHLIGMAASVAWLKLVVKESLFPPEEVSRPALYAAALGNVVGNLATNAAYALISSSTTQVIKACEPVFTFVLSLVLVSNREALTVSTIMSVMILITGACLFVVMDASFNVWGVVAAVCSNIAFPVRNIYLKKLSNFWNNSLQKYAIISAYSAVLLLPVISLKAVATKELFAVSRAESFVSSLSHFAYNVASIGVLQRVSPLTHAILNLSKRVFVILVNIAYFQTALSTVMLVGLLVFFIGIVLYHKSVDNATFSALTKKSLALVLICLLILLMFFYSPLNPAYNQSGATRKSLQHHNVVTSWVFSRPMPLTVISNIVNLGKRNPGMSVQVFCGTSQCVNALSTPNLANIQPEFLVIPDIVKDTPLEQWVARHPLNKILSQSKFENHLHEVVRLGLLWRYGGLYIDPYLRLSSDSNLPTDSFAWISEDDYGDVSLDVSYFPKNHTFISHLSELFVKEYSNQTNVRQLHFSKIVANAYQTCISDSIACPSSVAIKFQRFANDKDYCHYGTLSYDARVRAIKAVNVGDEIQGFPGLLFVPFVDHFVERDSLRFSAVDRHNITVFFNAWWGSVKADWPPPPNIQPIMISVHIHSSVQDIWAKNISYLKRHGPIGCRDHTTLNYLTKLGVESYFSGCLTLLMRSPFINARRTDDIFLVDVRKENLKLLPANVKERAGTLRHHVVDKETHKAELDGVKRFSTGYNLMANYATAKLVITQRIHCALPCVAMGTPVIFINSPNMPGGGGDNKEASERVSGLLPLFHTLDLYSLTEREAVDWLKNFPWDDPPPNPNVDLMMRLRATAWNVIRQDQSLYDAARKFGVLPLLRPPVQVVEQPLFHLIFNTSSLTTTMFNHSCERCSVREVIFWRSVESIFHHHPLAKVIIHSSTLLQSEFAVLTEAGYSIEVRQLDLCELLESTPAQRLAEKLNDSPPGQYLQLETFVLQAAILYKWGGLYLDTDVILIRPIDSLSTDDTVAWLDPHNTTLSRAFAKFQKGSVHLKAYLEKASESEMYANDWDSFIKEAVPEIRILNGSAFYTLGNKENGCHDVCQSDPLPIEQAGFGIQLRCHAAEREKIGPLCKQLFNTYCVLCNKQY